jgi:hypothetical protein
MCRNRSEGTNLKETPHKRVFKEEVAKLRRVSWERRINWWHYILDLLRSKSTSCSYLYTKGSRKGFLRKERGYVARVMWMDMWQGEVHGQGLVRAHAVMWLKVSMTVG